MAKSKLTQKVVKAIIAHEKTTIQHFETCDQKHNPQIEEMKLRHQGQLDAFEAILDSMKGSNAMLSTFLPWKDIGILFKG
jgi:hypothetical protein